MSNCKLSVMFLLGTLLLIMCSVAAYPQSPNVENNRNLQFSISFDKNKSAIDTAYASNMEQLEELQRFLSGISTINEITIYSNCSPDGAFWRNAQLSRQRGKEVEKALVSLIEKFDIKLDGSISTVLQPEDWTGLETLVESQYNRQDKQQLLAIIKSDNTISRKKQLINELCNGESMNVLMLELMPQLRKSVVVTIAVPSYLADETFEPLPENMPQAAQLIVSKPQPEILSVENSYEPEVEIQTPLKSKEYIFNLKTNLLLPLLNVGIEVPIKEKYTVGAEFYYPWIKPASNKWCSQMLAWFVDGKYWHTPKHGFGVYAGAGYYDFQNSKEGYQGEFTDIGADYTYSVSVGKKKWMKVQLNIGVGYIFTTARHYFPTDDYQILIKDPAVKSKNSHFVGPTRGGISLVFPIAKFWKGGER